MKISNVRHRLALIKQHNPYHTNFVDQKICDVPGIALASAGAIPAGEEGAEEKAGRVLSAGPCILSCQAPMRPMISATTTMTRARKLPGSLYGSILMAAAPGMARNFSASCAMLPR